MHTLCFASLSSLPTLNIEYSAQNTLQSAWNVHHTMHNTRTMQFEHCTSTKHTIHFTVAFILSKSIGF